MSRAQPSRADRELLDLCRELGLHDAEIKIGKKHHKLFIGGKLVRVLCHGNKSYAGDRGIKNAVADIKRLARGRQNEAHA